MRLTAASIRPGIDRLQRPVILGQPAGVVGDQGGVQQHFDQQMAEKGRPQPGFAPRASRTRAVNSSEVSANARVAWKRASSRRCCKTPPATSATHGSGSLQKRLDVFRPQPHRPIGHRQPIGHGRAGHEIRPIEKRQGVGEVVHAAYSIAVGRGSSWCGRPACTTEPRCPHHNRFAAGLEIVRMGGAAAMLLLRMAPCLASSRRRTEARVGRVARRKVEPARLPPPAKRELFQAIGRVPAGVAEPLANDQQIALGSDLTVCAWPRAADEPALGRLGLVTTAQRSRALVFTLLMFCPPGPPLRAKVNLNSLRGIRSCGLTMSIGTTADHSV